MFFSFISSACRCLALCLPALAAVLLCALPADARQSLGVVGAGSEVVAEIEHIACPLRLPPGDSGGCLRAWLPMDYAHALPDGSLPEDAPRISVHLVVLGNFIQRFDPDPLVVITGGPGQAGTDMVGPMSAALEQRRNRGVILIDQRGTGHSTPRLDCPDSKVTELDDYPFNDPSFDPQHALARRMAACRERLVAKGIDLSAFDSRHAAMDLKAIRRGLGLRQWNLLGTSYGARVVLDAMRIDPQGIRAVVLNSPMTLASGLTPLHALGRVRGFEQMFAHCAAQEPCATALPGLRRDLEFLADHLARDPLRLFLRDRESGALTGRDVYWADLVAALDMHLAFSPSAVFVARYIHEMAQVARGRLNLNEDEVLRIFQPDLADVEQKLAIGMHLSVRCREDFPGLEPQAVQEVSQKHPFYFPDNDLYDAYRRICPIWDVGEAVEDFAAPVRSAIPTLILSGDSDTLTPLRWAEDIAAELGNAQLVVFAGMGHDIFAGTPCARVITANFLDRPTASLDTICAANAAPLFVLEQD